MSSEKLDISQESQTKISPSEPEVPAGPLDWDGRLIEVGDTVYFHLLDQGIVLGQEEDGRIRIESYEKNTAKDRPWKIIWLIPAGLLRKKPEEEHKPKNQFSTTQSCCNR